MATLLREGQLVVTPFDAVIKGLPDTMTPFRYEHGPPEGEAQRP